MHYECPFCKSMKKPKIVNYFPPLIVECPDCSERGHEKDFIKQDTHHLPYVSQYP